MKDSSIRCVFFDWLEENNEKIRIYEESPIKSSRCDFYTVTDRLTGYEIKSDADTYERLVRQVPDYDAFFDENYIVVGATHRTFVQKKVPDYWGIICITDKDEGFIVETVREAFPNPKIKRKNQILKLWNSEISAILKRHRLPVMPGKAKSTRATHLIKSLDDSILRLEICTELFERDYSIK